MQFRALGRTGLNVSALSLGGAAFGGQYGAVTVADVRATVDAALDAGVNLIDTSAFYGEGRSETLLGEVLAGRRDRVVLCTKAGRLTRQEFDFTPAGIRASVEGSLRRLRTDRVEVLLAHDIEFAADFEQVFTETAGVLHALKAEGKCRFVGMSGLPLGLLRRAVERCHLDVVITYCHYTLQNTRLLTELLPAAADHSVGVINASPLAMGLLTPGGPPPWNPAPAEIRAACRAAADYCAARGASLATLGMQFAFAQSAVPTTLTGTARPAELHANLAAMATPPDADLLAGVRAILAPVLGQSWPTGNWREGA